MKIDAHQHFWIYSKEEYGWMNDQMSIIRQDFLPADLEKEQQKIGFDGSVAVQARQSLAENDFLLALAEQNDRVKGVVGWVDLCSELVAEELEQYAQHPKFVGLRHIVQDEAVDEFLLGKDFLRGIHLLSTYGMTYDILTFPKQLPATLKFVPKFPNQKFVLDHISKPFIKDGIIDPWKQQIQELARYDNLWCKLSGILTEADWLSWKATDFSPYLEVVLEAFGTDRLMIGSDWPVCRLAGEYEAAMRLVIDYIHELSEDEQAAILGGNCIDFYGLEV